MTTKTVFVNVSGPEGPVVAIISRDVDVLRLGWPPPLSPLLVCTPTKTKVFVIVDDWPFESVVAIVSMKVEVVGMVVVSENGVEVPATVGISEVVNMETEEDVNKDDSAA